MAWLRVVEAMKAPVGSDVTIRGWVRTRRDSKAEGGLSFVHVHDGSCFEPIQVVAKGDLQYLSRTSVGGQVFTVFDETGTKVPGASIWFSERMYTADKRLTPEGPLPVGQSLYVRALAFAHFDGVKWRKPGQPGLPVRARA